MSDEMQPLSDLILYQTEDGRTRIQCRFEDETVWLSQALMAELFQKDVRTINEHLVNIFEEGELGRAATIRKFRIVRREGAREVAREVEHYNLEAIISVGYLGDKVVRDFSRRDACSSGGVEVHSQRLSAKRSRSLFTTRCRLKSGTTFATRRSDGLLLRNTGGQR